LTVSTRGVHRSSTADVDSHVVGLTPSALHKEGHSTPGPDRARRQRRFGH
jgi:hypothetical protein